ATAGEGSRGAGRRGREQAGDGSEGEARGRVGNSPSRAGGVTVSRRAARETRRRRSSPLSDRETRIAVAGAGGADRLYGPTEPGRVRNAVTMRRIRRLAESIDRVGGAEFSAESLDPMVRSLLGLMPGAAV